MRKSKSEIKSDKIEESLQSLKTSGFRALRSASSEFANLQNDLKTLASVSPPKTKALFEKTLRAATEIENRFSNLESVFRENLEIAKESYSAFKSRLEQIEEEKRTLKILYGLSSALFSERDIDVLSDMIADGLVDLISAERSFIVILNHDKSIRLKLGKNQDKEIIQDENTNQSIIQAVLETGDAVCANGLISQEDEEKDKPSKFVSVLCAPMNCGEHTIGVLYLDSADSETPFTLEDVAICFSLADKAASSLENNFLFKETGKSSKDGLQDLRGKFKFDEILGDSPQMVEILKTVAEVADTDAAVLIEGESGTGKELLARAIHFNSGRREKPFVPINCAAIPETLLESELFGYEKGAFTGAEQKKLGKFDVANGGTIFLDEIGEMSLLLQVKILRFLQSHEFEPLGSNRIRKSDIRIIAATNKDLFSRVKENKFREDLYYRINVINIKLPALRERRTDVELLANFFASKFVKREEKKIKGINQEAINALCRYNFPGNVRELENIMERAVILAKGELVAVEDLPKTIFGDLPYEITSKTPQSYAELKAKKKKMIEQVEEDFVKNVLSKYNHNISRAAKEVKMHRVELQRMVKKYRE